MKTKISYLLLLALIISASRSVANGQDGLSGRIYEGEVGDQSTPLEGVTVGLYGSNDSGERGILLVSTATDSTGGYGLEVPDVPVYEFYNIIVPEPLSGYVFVNATTVSGTVKESNWIQYAYPLYDKTLTGNKFWQLHDLINNPPVVNAGHDPCLRYTRADTDSLSCTACWQCHGRRPARPLRPDDGRVERGQWPGRR